MKSVKFAVTFLAVLVTTITMLPQSALSQTATKVTPAYNCEADQSFLQVGFINCARSFGPIGSSCRKRIVFNGHLGRVKVSQVFQAYETSKVEKINGEFYRVYTPVRPSFQFKIHEKMVGTVLGEESLIDIDFQLSAQLGNVFDPNATQWNFIPNSEAREFTCTPVH